MATHDLECTKCAMILRNYSASPWPASPLLHNDCGGELLILWTQEHACNASAHPSERTVVWRDPDGRVAYPPRSDSPMPQRYKEAGYQRVEFEHARDLERFEKQHNVCNEKLWYNSGNGI